MAVDRCEVEALLAKLTPREEVLRELCEAWLALDAAPVVDVKECCSHAIIGSDWDDDLTGYRHVGQRVRLVAANGGDRAP